MPAFGQEEEDLEVEMFFSEEETVTSAARHLQEIGMSPSAITVITREDIEASGATTIPDLLRMVPGMEVITVSPNFTAITSRLYWTNDNNVYLVLIDGREANIELLGETPWELLPISIEDVERIEVIRGPGSALYGPNAVAGVVSIITRSMPEKTSAWIGLAGGEAGSASVGARASTLVGDWGFSISGGFDRAGTYTNHRVMGKEVWKLRSVAEYNLSDSQRILFDGAISEGSGPFTSGGMGTLDATVGVSALRLAYESESIRGRIYWIYNWGSIRLEAPLEYLGIRLANFVPIDFSGHTLDGEIQWTLPKIWEPLLIIVGGGARTSWLASNELLDGETYADPSSSRFHEPGIDHFEARAGAFIHSELAPVDWVTITGGLRFDYNTITEEFLSPRLAVVFQPVKGQFLRLGVARAFRMPAFFESTAHPLVEFPDDSPITGTDFLEFMTKVVGNSELDNEKLLSLEAGYLGRFLDGRLAVNLDLYCNFQTGLISIKQNIVADELLGLPDLDESQVAFGNFGPDFYILGSELSIRFNLTKSISLLASWTHREVFLYETGQADDTSPKNLITLGGRFRTDGGLLGSLYVFTRSEFQDRAVENPRGLLETELQQHMENVVLILGKFGWKIPLPRDFDLEIGLKLFMPISPFKAPHFRYREKGGLLSASGENFGGEELPRVVTIYLQGSI